MGIRLKGDNYYYEFMYKGKRHFGPCINEKTGETLSEKKAALTFEKKMKEKAKGLKSQVHVKALVENYKNDLTGGNPITLGDAYELSLKKPKKRAPGEARVAFKKAYWNNFLLFMNTLYPDIKTLSEVERRHAEDYIQHLRTNGKYIINSSNKGKDKEISSELLSPASLNQYHTSLAEVFTLLKNDTGIVDNPFINIPKLEINAESREAFSISELTTIKNNLDNFTRPLFTIAISTALREGDICTLKWSEIDLRNAVILRQKMRKTGNAVEIPMIAPLQVYMKELHESSMSRQPDDYSLYVLPDHAKMYLENRAGVSYRIKQFLEDRCKISTTRIPEGRTRAVSIKDLHSCRHTFCYYAGYYGIPLNIVQSIVGHMTPEMTKHYSAHASIEAKREKMKLLPSFLSLTANEDIDATEKNIAEEMTSLLAKIEALSQKRQSELNPIIDAVISADLNQLNLIREILKL